MTCYSECHVTKWYKVGFVTCIDGDPTRIAFTTDTVRLIHERLTSLSDLWVFYIYADDTTIFCAGETADLQVFILFILIIFTGQKRDMTMLKFLWNSPKFIFIPDNWTIFPVIQNGKTQELLPIFWVTLLLFTRMCITFACFQTLCPRKCGFVHDTEFLRCDVNLKVVYWDM